MGLSVSVSQKWRRVQGGLNCPTIWLLVCKKFPYVPCPVIAVPQLQHVTIKQVAAARLQALVARGALR
eukprot:5785990-Amphidinium_carterae.1